MRRYRDLTGDRFGRLEVTSFSEIRNRYYFWNCVCECGAACEI